MGTLWQDVRYGFRMLGRNPGIVVTAILCLGLGIGATTTIFGVVNAALLRPFPYQKPGALAAVWQESDAEPLSPRWRGISHADFFDCRASSRTFQDMTIISAATYPMHYGDIFEPVGVMKVASNLFDLLGVRPALGRPFLPEEDEKGNQQVAILTDACWRNWFHADPNVLGKSLTLRLYTVGEKSFTIVGVMPAQFMSPVYPTFKPDLLVPFEYTEPATYRDIRCFAAIGRLREERTFAETQAELDTLSSQLAQEYPKENAGWRFVAGPLRAQYGGEAGRVLYLLLVASGLLLVIACANVAGLLLIRGLHRQREIAVRTTLGAGRLRLLRQVTIEGLLLALLGLLAAVLISVWATAFLRPLIRSYVPVVGRIDVAPKVLAFAGMVALTTGLAFGLLPAAQAWRTNLSGTFRGDASHTTAGRRSRRTHSLLAASQIALAFILIVGAGLAVRTFSNLLRIDPGFQPRNVLTMQLDFQRGNYDDRQVEAFHDEFLTRVRRLPGVVAAATSNGLPLSDQGNGLLFDIEGDPTPPTEPYHSYTSWVSADYFRTLGVSLLTGRDFRESDRLNFQRPVVIVNRALAQRFWPSGNPVGQRLIRRRGDASSFEIIGVVENECYRNAQLTGKLDVSPRVYFNRYYTNYANVTVRTQADPLSLAPAVKALVREIDDQILVSRARSLEEDVREAFRWEKMTMLLVGVFALFAFALSIVGLYGMMAHSVKSRFQEIAIRMATGASPRTILALVLRDGAKVVTIGIAVGAVAMCALVRVAVGYVYGVTPMDPLTLMGALLFLTAASLVACSLPARRAARIDPMAALRCE